MDRKSLKEKALPDAPGVYFFLDQNKKILYIGKATSLKSRVNSYFVSNIKDVRSPLIERMISDASSIDFTTTDSVLEALILETNLIRSHKPPYNTKSKDDKSYNHLIITNEEWPRVLVVRGKDLTEKFDTNEIKYHFGPFPSGVLLREALKIIRKLFKFYDTKMPVTAAKTKMSRGKIDFNRQIGLYPGGMDQAEYQDTIRHLKLFFQGKKAKIISELEKKMHVYAKNHEFEQANLVKKKVFALKHIEDIALIKNDYASEYDADLQRIEAYDVAHLAGKDMVGVMTVVVGGETRTSDYRKFKIRTLTNANDPAALYEILKRRFGHDEWPKPNIIVVDGNEIQMKAAAKAVAEFSINAEIVAVVKDERHKASRIIAPLALKKYNLEILLANAEAHRFAINYYRNLSRKNALR